MKRHFPFVAGTVALTAAALGWSSGAVAQETSAKAPTDATAGAKAPAERATLAQASVQRAAPQGAVVAASDPAVYAEAPSGYTGPNRSMIGTGLVTFGLSYIPSVIVASQSSLDADHHLYVPVAGPWLDFMNRPDCNARAVSCDTENTNKVLLVVDGVAQGIGALTTVLGLFSTEHESAAANDKPTVHVTPAQMGAGGVGAAAFGTF